MAEFFVVMKHAKRMCAAHESRCDRCPFGHSDGCPFDFFKHHMKSFDFNEVEHIVMDWAAKNPESRYPTWAEWQKANFPNASTDMCPRAFGIMCVSECIAISCDECTDQHIPADIADKLGIKQIGEKDNG